MMAPIPSATMSLTETVRGGKKICVNSIATARQKQLTNTATDVRARARRPRPKVLSSNQKNDRGTKRTMLLTQSARDSMLRLRYGIAMKYAQASANGRGRNVNGTLLQ